MRWRCAGAFPTSGAVIDGHAARIKTDIQMFIAVEGGIGAGKTTTARMLAERLGCELILENTDVHPFLHAFYENPARFALETELGFVLLHYHQLHRVTESSLVVTDFSPVKDLAFARMNLRVEDATLFGHVYERLIGRLPQPALAVFLDLDVDELLARIRRRGRPYELGMTRDYLLGLRGAYGEIFEHLAAHVRVMQVLPTDSRDVVAEKALQAIRESQVLHSLRA